MPGLNERAWKLLERADLERDHLGLIVKKAGGAWLFDAGRQAPGGVQAGLLMAGASTAGLAELSLSQGVLDGKPWPQVDIACDQPWLACFACQSANWSVDTGGLKGMGSGPACLLGSPEKFEQAALDSPSRCAVLVLETSGKPSEAACQDLAWQCRVAAENLAVIFAPTSSLSGVVQIAARSVETALHKLHRLGFDLHKVRSSSGRCPVAPPSGDDWIALGMTNDAMTYGSQVSLAVAGIDDASLERLVPEIPSCTSPSYGKPFLETLQQAGGFYHIDPGLFAPAEVTLVNLETGRVFHAGRRDEERLASAMQVK